MSNRTTGSLGMSVGTSLAFEANGAGMIATNNHFLINIYTLIRNVIQSFEVPNENVKELSKYVIEDIKLIGEFIEASRGSRPVGMSIYKPNYDTLKNDYKFADLWVPTTAKQKANAELTAKVLRECLKTVSNLVKNVKHTAPTFSGRGVILTNHPVDLIGLPYGRTFLLESHTGTLKPFNLWYTKLTNGNNLYNMPLNKLTIQIFGDRSTNFKSQSLRIKKVVESLAERDKWTSNSSVMRIRASILKHDVDIERKYLLSMLG